MVSAPTNVVVRGLMRVGTQNQASCQSVSVRTGVSPGLGYIESCCTGPGRSCAAGRVSLRRRGTLERNQVSVILVGLWGGHMKGKEDGMSSIRLFVESTQ